MKTLLAVEIRRMISRPLVRRLAAASVLVIGLTGVIIFATSHPASSASVQLVRLRTEQALRGCVASGFRPPFDRVPVDSRREFCVEQVPHPRFTFELVQLVGILEGAEAKGSSSPLVLMSLIVGVSVVGAEFTKRTIMTTLLWEPRRVRLIFAKILSCAAIAFGHTRASSPARRRTSPSSRTAWDHPGSRWHLVRPRDGSGAPRLGGRGARGGRGRIGGGDRSKLGLGARRGHPSWREQGAHPRIRGPGLASMAPG